MKKLFLMILFTGFAFGQNTLPVKVLTKKVSFKKELNTPFQFVSPFTIKINNQKFLIKDGVLDKISECIVFTLKYKERNYLAITDFDGHNNKTGFKVKVEDKDEQISIEFDQTYQLLKLPKEE